MLLSTLLAVALVAQLQTVDPLVEYRAEAASRWDAEIQKLEELDQIEKDPEGAVLFLGSSSIRRWETIAEDLAPWPVIRRGYGGARFSDMAVFVERLIKRHRFQAAVIFVGNDIAGTEKDKTPAEVLRLVKLIVGTIHAQDDDAEIFLIGITPTPSRFQVWEQIQRANALIADYCAATDKLHFIRTDAIFLDESGKPRESLFVEDRLHLNEAGYQLWSATIRSHFEKVLVAPSEQK